MRVRDSKVIWFAKIGFSIGLILWLVSTAGLPQIVTTISGVDLAPLGLAAVLALLGPALIGARWRVVLRARGVAAPYGALVRSSFIASFFVRQFLPSSIGGDALRVYDAWRLGASRSVALVSVGVDRFCGMAVMLLFATVAGLTVRTLLERWPLELGGVLAVTGVVFLSVAWLLFVPHTGPIDRLVAWSAARLPAAPGAKLEALWAVLTAYRGKTAVIAQGLSWSVLLQINVVLFFSLIGWSLRLPISLAEYFVIVPLAWLVMLLPVSINGIGLREAIYVVLLGASGATEAQAIAFAWLEYAVMLAFGVVGAVLFMYHPLRRELQA